MNNIICDNCYKVFLKKINGLTEELKCVVFSYINPIKLYQLNHYFYDKYHFIISSYINSRNYQNYVYDIIRKDNDLAFKYLLNELENITNQFTTTKVFHFKKKKFKNTETFLLFLCKYHESNRCRELLINHEQFKIKQT